MRSDHWNFLANLLGTPGTPEPAETPATLPEKEKQDEKEKQESTIAAELDHQDSASKPTVVAAEQQTPVPTTDKKSQVKPADAPHDSESVEDVIEALRSVTPPKRIPGFGPPKKESSPQTSAGELSAKPAMRDTPSPKFLPSEPVGVADLEPTPTRPVEVPDLSLDDDEPWGGLANELGLGFDPAAKSDVPSISRSAAGGSSQSATGQSESRSSDTRSSWPRKASGFGSGLGIDDLDSGPFEVDDATDQEAPVAFAPEDDDDSNDRSLSQRDALRRQHSEPASRRERDQAKKSPVSDDAVPPPGRSSESDLDTRRDEPSRRRGRRRGVRQRISEEIAQGEVVESTDVDDSWPSRAAKPDRSADDRHRSGREKSETTAREGASARDREPTADRRTAKKGFADNLDSDSFDPDDDDFGAGFAAELLDAPLEAIDEVDSDDDSEGESSKPRPRRRGRRGGRRRRSRDELEKNETTDTTDTTESLDSEEDLFDEPPPFDDDHEDDDEVEVIRRGRRRSRSGRDPMEPTETSETSESRGRGKQRGGRDGSRSDAERLGSAERNPLPRRADIPTWLETVTVFVDSNVENHKKSPPRGGRGRGGGKRR